MSERVTMWGDLLRRRADHRFVGRRHELEQFRLNFLYGVPQALLFVVRGPGGIGKSALLDEYAAIATEHGFVTACASGTDLNVPGEVAVLQLMVALAKQLSAAGVPLTTFDEVLREYTAAYRTIVGDPEAPGSVWGLFGGVDDSDAWSARAWDEYLLYSFSLRRSPLIRDPIGTLTERFVQDFNAWATVRRILLCIDDFEVFLADGTVSRRTGMSRQAGASRRAGSAATLQPPKPDAVGAGPAEWLLNLLTHGHLSTNVWFMIASRDPFPQPWDALAPVQAEASLHPLSCKESAALLRQLNVSEDLVAAGAFDENSRDLVPRDPLSLTLWARVLQSRPQGEAQETLPADTATLVEHYVAGLAPMLRAAVLKCVAARWLDQNVISALVGDQAVAQVLEWLEDSPLVVEVPNCHQRAARSQNGSLGAGEAGKGWRFRRALQSHLDALVWRAGGFTWEEAHQTLHAFYRQQGELRGPEDGCPGHLYLDPDWQHIHLEALYHALVSGDENEVCDAALSSFLKGVRQFHPWAGAVVRVWREAAVARHSAGQPPASVISRWAQVVGDGWIALARRDWEAALAFTDQVLAGDDAPWSAETRQAVRTLRQLIAGRLALPPEDAGAHHRDGELERSQPEPESAPAGAPAVLVEAAPVAPVEVVRSDVPAVTEPSVDALIAPEFTAEPPLVPKAVPSSGGEAVEPETSVDTALVEDYMTQASMHLGQEAYDAAIDAYSRALALDPDAIVARYHRGFAYTRIGALGNALTDLTRVIELDADPAGLYRLQALQQRGLVYVRQGEFDRAIADFDAFLENAGRNQAVLGVVYERANTRFRLQAYEQAIADYTQVLQQDPEHVEAFLNRGRSYAALGDYPEAIRDYNRAIALQPNRAVGYSSRGQAYVRMKRYGEALGDYARALELNPRDAAVHNARGLLYIKIAAFPDAIDAYQHAMAIQPDWATPYYNAACAATLAGDTERALTWLARAIALREEYRTMALRDPDFAAIRDEPRFAALVGTGAV